MIKRCHKTQRIAPKIQALYTKLHSNKSQEAYTEEKYGKTTRPYLRLCLENPGELTVCCLLKLGEETGPWKEEYVGFGFTGTEAG